MKKLNRANTGLSNKPPIKVMQFGEGNFLRAFVEFAFQKLNIKANFNGGIAVVQPINRGMVHMLNQQDGLYTLFLNGIKKGHVIQEKELITNIVGGVDPYQEYDEFINLAREDSLEFVISNTTEAGIAYDESDTIDMTPPNSFPAKMTQVLYERFKHFKGDPEKGLTIIPCELINYNSDSLRDIILKYSRKWKLEDSFVAWIENDCTFHNTLVDRIVPGYPRDEIETYNEQLEYEDNLIVVAETFFLWVIEGDDKLKEKLPFEKTGLDVKIVKDMQPYRTRKVRILNGAHTSIVPLSLLYGNLTVKETVDNDFTGQFLHEAIFGEIIETLNMDREELNGFAEEVLDRFRNPFIKHKLADIALNSISKFKVRVLPSLLAYIDNFDKIPRHLTFSMACLIRFYKGNWNGTQLPINDNDEITEEFNRIWAQNDRAKVVESVLKQVDFWDRDLSTVDGLTEAVTSALVEIDSHGIEKGFANFSEQY